MRPERFFTTAALSLFVLLAGCDRNNASTGDGADSDLPYERVNGRLMGDLTLLGTVAGTDHRPFVSLCAQDQPEGDYNPLCTATDSDAGYRMLGLFSRSGLLESQFTDRFGRERQLFGLYDLTNGMGATDSRANINPLASLISHAYVHSEADQSADDCFNGDAAQACAEALDGGLDQSVIDRILANLEDWIAPVWPEDATSSVLADDYSTTVSSNPWLDLHRRIDLTVRYDEPTDRMIAEAYTLPVTETCEDTLVATVPIAELTLLRLPQTADLLTDAEAANSVADCTVTNAGSESDYIEIIASPPAGTAPLTTRVTINAEANGESLPFSAQLLNPRGQLLDAWTTTENDLVLENIGTYRIAVDAVLGERSVTGGLAIPVSAASGRDSPLTWGLAGSCRTPDNQNQLINLRNICLEKADGTVAAPPTGSSQCDALTERPELNYSQGVCSQSEQYDEPLLGVCAQPDNDTRIFHYRDPVTSETGQQQHDRLENQCTGTFGGTWDSRL